MSGIKHIKFVLNAVLMKLAKGAPFVWSAVS